VRLLSRKEFGVLVVIALVAAVAFVLITPDPTDDVDAVLHMGKSLHVPAFQLADLLDVGLGRVSVNHSSPIVAPFNVSQSSIELFCSCRC